MKAIRIVGVVAFFMLSACAGSNREGYAVVRQPSSVYVVHSSDENEPQQYSSGQVHAIAYGQVLSYWASQLK